MKLRHFFVALFLASFTMSYAQYSINDYKYVIVEKQFHFQTEPNQYDLNRMVKFQFEKLGFTVIGEGQKLPEDLKSNYCLALTSEVRAKGLLRTKAKVALRNCHGEDVYISGEGVTKEKDLTRAFDVAIRKAFETMQGLNYNYVPNEAITSIGNNSKEVKEAEEKIEQLEAEIKELKEEKEDIKEKETAQLEISEAKQEKEGTKPLSELKKSEEIEGYANKYEGDFTLEEIFNGFKLLDRDSKEEMTIFHSGVKDVFIVKGKDAIIYKKGDSWIYSETTETNLLTKVIKIEF